MLVRRFENTLVEVIELVERAWALLEECGLRRFEVVEPVNKIFRDTSQYYLARRSRAMRAIASTTCTHFTSTSSLPMATFPVELEQTEVAAERDAFEAFREWVAEIETVAAVFMLRCVAGRASHDTEPAALGRVRSAYRETVMRVPTTRAYTANHRRPVETVPFASRRETASVAGNRRPT